MAARDKKLKFRNVRISEIHMGRKKESAPFVKVKFRADLSDPIRKAMGWSVGDGQTKGDFAGTINATRAVFAPNQKKLPGFETPEADIDITLVSEFKYSDKKDKDGNSKGQELTFTAVSHHAEAEMLFGSFWRSILGGDSQLDIYYQSIGVQAVADDDKTDDDEDDSEATE